MRHLFNKYKNTPLASRRTFLRGAGVCLSLPWLEALVPRTARGQAEPSAPLRFLPIYFPNGAAADFWSPQGVGQGDDWGLSPILQPFEALKHKMIAYSNFENYSCMQTDLQVEPSHARCSGAYLTCVDADAAREAYDTDVANGISVDQLLVESLQRETAFASLQFGLSTVESFCDGRHCSLSQSISWKSATEPLYKEVNPQAAFDLLVGSTKMGQTDAQADEAAARRRALDQSVLDAVLQNAKRTNERLGMEDKRRMEQFLDSVRDLEVRVNQVSETMTPDCQIGSRPDASARYGLPNGSEGYDRGVHAAAMQALIVFAFRCDATRVISYMLDDARSDFVYDHLENREFSATDSQPGQGRVGGYHGLQHAGDSNNGYATINWWLSKQIADLCLELDSIDEGDGSLLDHSVVLYGSGMHGSNHSANELPIVTLGSGGGRLRTDQHISFQPTPDDRPLRDLHYTLLNEVFQANVGSFGASVTGGDERLIDEILL